MLHLWLIIWIFQFVLFFVTPSQNASLIERHIHILVICNRAMSDLSLNDSYSMMTDEGSALVKVSSSVIEFNHLLWSFHVNQLDVRVNRMLLFRVTRSLLRTHFYELTCNSSLIPYCVLYWTFFFDIIIVHSFWFTITLKHFTNNNSFRFVFNLKN